MSIFVLKFGGSVLTSEAALHRCVAEIYRYTRDGHKVVALVSAFKGETDRLMRLAASYTEASRSLATSHLLATAETQAATLLAMACERSGLSTAFRNAVEIGLLAQGERLNAQPVSIQIERIKADLEGHDLVVIPGFIAQGTHGEPVLLGRGGTDFSAVYIAKQLDASVRLYKDVDAVYDADPATIGDAAKPYAGLSWDDAQKIAFPVVQAKAMQWAAKCEQPIEVTALARSHMTLLGAQQSLIVQNRPAPRPIRLAVMGAGGVGSRFLERCREWEGLVEVKQILVRDTQKRRDDRWAHLYTQDARLFAQADVDIFVDIGTGVSPSAELLEGFLAKGISVTSANKQAVAHSFDKLKAAAKATGAILSFSACVGGGSPVIEALIRSVRTGKIKAFSGVLNGTSNFVIDQVQAGKSFEAAMEEARRLGFAEPDSTADLDGTDVGAKLKILREIVFPGQKPAHIEVGAINEDNLIIPKGKGLRYVARCWLDDKNALNVSMKLETLDEDHFLVGARGEQNRAIIEADGQDPVFVSGKGAGAWPTSESLLADVLDMGRQIGII